MYGVVYRAKNSINGKIYIGITTTNLSDRVRSHLHYSRLNNPKFRVHQAIKKYGEENFSWKVIKTCENEKQLKLYESFFIKKFDSHINGYNMTLGGDNSPMFDDKIKKYHSKRTKQALSNPVVKKKQKLNTKLALNIPKIKKKQIDGIKKSWTDERKAHHSKIMSGSKNLNAKYIWSVYKDDIFIENTTCLKTWCENNNLNYHTMYNVFIDGRISRNGYRFIRNKKELGSAVYKIEIKEE